MFPHLFMFILLIQITTGLTLLFLGSLNMNKPQNQKLANILNNVVTGFIFIISVVNVIISSFGIESAVLEDEKNSKRQKQLIQGQSDIKVLESSSSNTGSLSPAASLFASSSQRSGNGNGSGGHVSFNEAQL